LSKRDDGVVVVVVGGDDGGDDDDDSGDGVDFDVVTLTSVFSKLLTAHLLRCYP